jgi:hypothetical protein
MSIVRRSERIEKVPARSGWMVAYPDITPFSRSVRIAGDPGATHLLGHVYAAQTLIESQRVVPSA